MEEILHHLGCIDSVNNGILTISAGAGFHPSTVVGYVGNISYSLLVATRRRKRQRLDLISSLTWKLKQRNHERTKNPSSRFHLVFFSTVFTPKNWSRWWFHFFSPLFGEDEPILTSIFFTWVGEKPSRSDEDMASDESGLKSAPSTPWDESSTPRVIFAFNLETSWKQAERVGAFSHWQCWKCFNPYISSSYPYMCMSRPSLKRACKKLE